MNLEAMGQYGPAGMILSGSEFSPRQRELLADSYRKLGYALTLLKGSSEMGLMAYLVLLAPYLSDPADPSIVAEWRKRGDKRLQWHDLAVEKLATYLEEHDLFVIWPKRMTSREEKQVERMNDEFYAVFQRLKEDGMGTTAAVKTAAEMCGYTERTGWRIVEARREAC